MSTEENVIRTIENALKEIHPEPFEVDNAEGLEFIFDHEGMRCVLSIQRGELGVSFRVRTLAHEDGSPIMGRLPEGEPLPIVVTTPLTFVHELMYPYIIAEMVKNALDSLSYAVRANERVAGS